MNIVGIPGSQMNTTSHEIPFKVRDMADPGFLKRHRSIGYLILIFTLATAIYGLYQAVVMSWTGDDAFISFRYAKNLIEGHGLVFNTGEHVEGYSNFLWTILMAAGMFVGLDPVGLSSGLGILSFLMTAGVYYYLSQRLFAGRVSILPSVLPMTAICLLVMHDFQVWATGGLETSFLTMLLSLGYGILVCSKGRKSVIMAGFVMTLAALTRPDALLFFVMTLVYLVIQGRNNRRNLIFFLLPFILFYIPYWFWRYDYYGYLFPNTYYAKSASLAWYSQGLTYLWLYVKTYYCLLLVLPASIIMACYLAKKYKDESQISPPPDRAALLAILFLFPYLFYVVRVGGGFMFARFFIPVIPFALFLLEGSIRWLQISNRVKLILLAAVIVGSFFQWNQYDPPKKLIRGIAYERAFYPPRHTEQRRNLGLELRRFFEGKDVSVAFLGSYASLVYYSEVPVAIETDTGLTDEYIAHLPLRRRGRPGHEKKPPFQYLFERGVNFTYGWFSPFKKETGGMNAIFFGDFLCHILVYNVELMNALKAFPQIRFVDVRNVVDEFIKIMHRYDDMKVARAYTIFKNFYFNHNDDKLREQVFISRLTPDEKVGKSFSTSKEPPR